MAKRGKSRMPSPFKYRGGWRAQVTLKNGTRPAASFDSVEEAQAWISDMLADQYTEHEPELGGPTKATLAEALRHYARLSLGGDFIQESFLISFLVLGAAVPVFGWIVAHAPRWLIVPAIYGFFIACLIGFWLLHRASAPSSSLAGVFFIWVNVFALFTVSLFWSSMSDAFNREQAKRLFGIISLGDTLGRLTGPILVDALLTRLGTEYLFLISGLFLALAAAAAVLLRRSTASDEGTDSSKPSAVTLSPGRSMSGDRPIS